MNNDFAPSKFLEYKQGSRELEHQIEYDHKPICTWLEAIIVKLWYHLPRLPEKLEPILYCSTKSSKLELLRGKIHE
jgi:hypothetical protein